MSDNALVERASASIVPTNCDLMPTARWARENGYRLGNAWQRADHQLIPPDKAKALAGEVRRALEPAGKRAAAPLARQLLCCFPMLNSPDPQGYAAMVANELATLPADLAAATADILTKVLRFPPSRAEILAVANKLIAKRRDMLEDAESHIREHERRERRQREAAEEAEARRDVPDWDAVVTGNARACGILPSEARAAIMADINDRVARGKDRAAAGVEVTDEIRRENTETQRKHETMMAELHRKVANGAADIPF
jgi:hypothetical protein